MTDSGEHRVRCQRSKLVRHPVLTMHQEAAAEWARRRAELAGDGVLRTSIDVARRTILVLEGVAGAQMRADFCEALATLEDSFGAIATLNRYFYDRELTAEIVRRTCTFNHIRHVSIRHAFSDRSNDVIRLVASRGRGNVRHILRTARSGEMTWQAFEALNGLFNVCRERPLSLPSEELARLWVVRDCMATIEDALLAKSGLPTIDTPLDQARLSTAEAAIVTTIVSDEMLLEGWLKYTDDPSGYQAANACDYEFKELIAVLLLRSLCLVRGDDESDELLRSQMAKEIIDSSQWIADAWARWQEPAYFVHQAFEP